MPSGWEDNSKSGIALAMRYRFSVFYPLIGSKPKEGRGAPCLHSSWGMAHFTFFYLSQHTAHYLMFSYIMAIVS